MDELRESSTASAMPARLYDRGDLARLFRVTRETVRIWERKGRLPGPIVVGTKSLWTAEAIAALLKGGVS